jgi:hypothetical protein
MDILFKVTTCCGLCHQAIIRSQVNSRTWGLDKTAVLSKPAHQTVIYTVWHIPDVVLVQFSWWWAHGCPKHAENRNKHTWKITVRQVGYLQRLHFYLFGFDLQPDHNMHTFSCFCAHFPCCCLIARFWRGRNVFRANTFHSKYARWSLYWLG